MVYFYIVEQVENNVSYTSNQYNASTTSISSPSQTAHNAAVRKQQQAQADNAAQSAAFWALRGGGKAEAAAQMASPISTQTFNTKQGIYVVEGRGKSEARIAAEAETERIQKMLIAEQAKVALMISTSQNSTVMPSSNAQNQITFGPQLPVTSYVGSLSFVAKNLVSNDNVNPLTLYGPQPVNSNNKSQNSTPVSNSIVTNANYNYATDMNNYQTANPGADVNMGQGPQPYVNTNQSTAPKSNEVATNNLGGDIQHQETDLTTNVESTPQLEQGYHRMADGSIMANSDMEPVNSDSNGIMSRLGVFGLGLLAVGGIALVGMNRR